MDKSVEFSYEELAKATDNFSVANKIGEGGFASVFYGIIRGQVISSLSLLFPPWRMFFSLLKFKGTVSLTQVLLG